MLHTVTSRQLTGICNSLQAYSAMTMTFTHTLRALSLLVGCLTLTAASAQQIDVHFSCASKHADQGLDSLLADTGKIKINGDHIEEFYWESSVFHQNLGVECSIDQDDGLFAEFTGDDAHDAWRIKLADAKAARDKRGYDFSHGYNCTIRVERHGDIVHINPSCPALCGSRQNFSEVSVDVKTGACQYE